MADIRTSPLPQMGQTTRPVLDQAVSTQKDYGFRGVAVENTSAELDGLMRGLSAFNSNLGVATEQAIKDERKNLTEVAQKAALNRAATADMTNGVDAVMAQDLPANVPVAYGPIFKDALGELLVNRAAVKMKTDWAAAYEEARKDPNFDSEKFITDFRTKALSGIQDPILIGSMGKQLTEMEGSVRVAAEKERLLKLDQEVNTGIFASLQENIRADMTPEQMSEAFTQGSPMWQRLGKSKKELASMFFGRLQYLSDQMGGSPDVFKAMDSVDPDTKQTLLALNPDLAQSVSRARDEANQKQLKRLKETAQTDNLSTRVALDEQLEKDPGSITTELVLKHMGPLGLFQTTDEAAAFIAKARKQQAAMQGDQAVAQAYDMGMLGRFKPEDQQKALEAKLGPYITGAWQKAVQGDGQAMGQLASFILAEQNRSKATVPVQAIERLIASNLSTVQDPAGVTPGFAAVAALYRGLSADPQFRSMYFKDDADQLMRSYLRGTDGGSDTSAAYKQAYESISPEAKARAESFVKSDDFKKKLKKVTDDVQGVGFWARWTPFGQEPENGSFVQEAVKQAVKDYAQRTPYASDDELKEFARTWTSRNFIMDSNTGSAIRVPEGYADSTTQEALSEYASRVADVYRLKDRNDGTWKVQFRPMGDGNIMGVVLSNGAAEQSLGTVPLKTLRDASSAEKVFSPQDTEVLREVQKQMRLGKLDLNFIEANSGTLAKAEKLEGLPKETLKAIDKLRLDNALEQVNSVPKLAMPLPTLEHLRDTGNRGVKVDNKLTANIASNTLARGGHEGLAASLITMGESVVLKASPDPAKDAGMNIGMGYNLKANASTYRKDLLRAGVPEDKVEAVAKGEAQLTPTQAERLLMVSLPRYEKQAQEAAEGTAKGLWQRMTPAQRAVMVDVAWQTGNPDKFRQAWRALARGDSQAFAEETKVYYTNRNGERVEDKRRNELRAAMLNGDSVWIATINKFGSFPSTALDALALNQK